MLRLRGLPFTATAEDVVDFLIGRRGRREDGDGEKRKKKEKKKEEEGGDEEEEEEPSSSPEEEEQPHSPPPTNPEAMPRLGPRGVVFTSSPDGRPSGEAYVEFETARAAAAALEARDGAALGPRFVRCCFFVLFFLFFQPFLFLSLSLSLSLSRPLLRLRLLTRPFLFFPLTV